MLKIKKKTGKKSKLKKPKLYKVLMHNDNYTTMEFVVNVLMVVFNKSYNDAVEIMLKIHRKGIGLCGVFPYDLATTKVEIVHYLANKKGFPLKCSIEPEED
jgi:ATP-dependent Clp protease adaptor protein ClpS